MSKSKKKKDASDSISLRMEGKVEILLVENGIEVSVRVPDTLVLRFVEQAMLDALDRALAEMPDAQEKRKKP